MWVCVSRICSRYNCCALLCTGTLLRQFNTLHQVVYIQFGPHSLELFAARMRPKSSAYCSETFVRQQVLLRHANSEIRRVDRKVLTVLCDVLHPVYLPLQ